MAYVTMLVLVELVKSRRHLSPCLPVHSAVVLGDKLVLVITISISSNFAAFNPYFEPTI